MLLCYLVGVSLLQYMYLYNIRLVKNDLYPYFASKWRLLMSTNIMLFVTSLRHSHHTCCLRNDTTTTHTDKTRWQQKYLHTMVLTVLNSALQTGTGTGTGTATVSVPTQGRLLQKQGCHLTWALMAASCRVATRISFRLRHMSSCVS